MRRGHRDPPDNPPPQGASGFPHWYLVGSTAAPGRRALNRVKSDSSLDFLGGAERGRIAKSRVREAHRLRRRPLGPLLSSLFFRAKWPPRDQWRGVAGGGGVASTRMQMFERARDGSWFDQPLDKHGRLRFVAWEASSSLSLRRLSQMSLNPDRTSRWFVAYFTRVWPLQKEQWIVTEIASGFSDSHLNDY